MCDVGPAARYRQESNFLSSYITAGINAQSYFNQQVTNVLLDLYRESNYRVRLASVALYGVSF